MSPTPIVFFIAKYPPNIDTPTYPKLPTNCIIGIIIPDKNCDFQADSYKTPLALSNSSIAFSSPLNTLTTLCPPYNSST